MNDAPSRIRSRARALLAMLVLSVEVAAGGCRAKGPTVAAEAAPLAASASASDVTYAAFSRARRSLDASLAASEAAASRDLTFVMTGTLLDEGHYHAPYVTKSYAWEVTAVVRADGSIHQRTRFHDDPELGFTACRGSEAILFPAGAAEPDPSASAARHACRAAGRLLPHQILREAQRNAASLRWIGEQSIDGEPCDVIGYVDQDGRHASLLLERRRSVLVRWERLVAHPQLGDTTEWVAFSGYRDVDGLLLPERRVERWLDEDSADTRDVKLALAPAETEQLLGLTSAFAASAWVSIEGATPPVKARRPPEVTEIAPDVFMVVLPEEDVKTLFVLFDEYVVALDAPLRSAAGEDILAAIRRHAGDRPVRYLVVGHHHPHYVAGLRPFVHAGATVVTTQGNVELVRDYAARPHQIQPDDLARHPRAPEIEVVDGRRVISDAHHQLELHDIGSFTGHTDEYLIYYFPREKLLVEGDLASFPESGEVRRARKATQGLSEAIQRLGLDVETIVQTWPLVGQKRIASRKDLESTLRAAEAPAKPTP